MPLPSPLDRLAAHLENLREEGVEWVEVDAGAREALAAAVKRSARVPAARRPVPPAATSIRQPAVPPVPRPASPLAPERGTASSVDAVGELDAVAREVAACTRCGLHATRTRTVPGQGNPRTEVLFVGEGPGADEDAQGLAFVGVAGQLLTKMIAAMGYDRGQVFIANIVKCRPPENRKPFPEEMDACLPYLRRQIAALRPKVIVALGATAFQGLLNTGQGITKARGHWFVFEGIDTMPTFHPSYLLRVPSAKKDAWEDLKLVMDRLGLQPPTPGPKA